MLIRKKKKKRIARMKGKKIKKKKGEFNELPPKIKET